MATLSAGQSVSFTLYANTTLAISGTGSLVNFSSLDKTPISFNGWSEYGPLDHDCSISISSTSTTSYGLKTAKDNALWTDRSELVSSGSLSAFFTDVGVGGSYWDYVGGRWRASARSVTLYNGIAPITLNSATNTVIDYCPVLPGLIQDGDWIELSYLAEKDGVSDTYTVDICLGASAATVGAALGFVAGGLATTARDISPARESFRRETATTIRRTSAGGTQGTGTSTSGVTSITVPSMDALTYLQFVARRSTGATETLTLRSFVVKLYSGA